MQGFEKGYSGFSCESELETEHNWNILTPKLWPSALCLSCLQGCSTGGPGPTLLCDGFLYCILSASSLDPKLHRGSRGPLRPGVAFHTTSRISQTGTRTQLARRTQLSYIIVRRPLNLWNRMFNHHQAEITVMLFRGHSLPVRQSMRVSWDFLACPILLANFRAHDFLS